MSFSGGPAASITIPGYLFWLAILWGLYCRRW